MKRLHRAIECLFASSSRRRENARKRTTSRKQGKSQAKQERREKREQVFFFENEKKKRRRKLQTIKKLLSFFEKDSAKRETAGECNLTSVFFLPFSLWVFFGYTTNMLWKESFSPNAFFTWRVSVVVDTGVDGGIDGVSVVDDAVAKLVVPVWEVIVEMLGRGWRHRRRGKPKTTATTTGETTVPRSLTAVTVTSYLMEGVFGTDYFLLDNQQFEGRDVMSGYAPRVRRETLPNLWFRESM